MKRNLLCFFVYTLLFVTNQLTGQLSNPELLSRNIGYIQAATTIFTNSDQQVDFLTYRNNTNDIDDPNYINGIFHYESYTDSNEVLKYSSTYYPYEDRIEAIWDIDIDHDGDQDALVVMANDNFKYCRHEALIWEDTIFRVEKNLPSILTDSCFIIKNIIDQNGDGYDDFLITDDSNSKLWLAQYQFDEEDYNLIYLTEKPSRFKVGDVNSDGILDVVFDKISEKRLELLYSTSENSYSSIVLDTLFNHQKDLEAFEDFNGDGKADILFENSNLDTLYIVTNPFDYKPKACFAKPFGGLFVLDINLDGHQDIYLNNTAESIFLNDGLGNFTDTDEIIPNFPTSIDYTFEDYQSNTAQYIYFSNNIDILNHKEDKWSSEVPFLPEIELQSLDDVQLIDINNDGFKELVFASRWGHSIAYLDGLPDGKFGDTKVLKSEEGAYNLEFADMNKDGNIDLIYSSIWGGNVIVSYGNGKGEFLNDTTLIANGGLLRGTTVTDYNKDGYPDIVYSSLAIDDLILIKNNAGDLSEHIIIDQLSDGNLGYEEIISKDLNQDGYEDLLVAIYYTSGYYKVLLNDTQGGYKEDGFIICDLGNLFFADFDKDGINEIITNNDSSITISKFENGTFQSFITLSPDGLTIGSSEYIIIDYNGDKYIDIIVEESGGVHRLYKNINNQYFEYDDLFESKFDYKLPDHTFLNNVITDTNGDRDLDYLFATELGLWQIRDISNEPSLKGFTFWDENVDSTYQNGEIGISNLRVEITDENNNTDITYTKDNGIFQYWGESGEYDVRIAPDTDCWEPIIETQSVEILNAIKDTLYHFPVKKIGDNFSILSSLSRAPTRCGFTIRYYFKIINNGCQPIYGNLKVDLDHKTDSIYLISLDQYNLENTSITHDFNVLLPGEVLSFNMLVTIPDFTFVGEYLHDAITIHYDEVDGSLMDKIYNEDYSSEIRCAIDPNDKIVNPDRSSEYGDKYILDENLIYTIRFQNTGNDTAFTVRLLDTLSTDLDLRTFQPLDASHPYRLNIHEQSRILEVLYENILLPDSTTNEIASNGFFTFTIKPVEGLEDFTPIYNSAGIYFDFNPPVITNTTKVEYVSDLSILSDTDDQLEEDINVIPNPANDKIRITNASVSYCEAIDVNGRIHPLNPSKGSIDISSLIPGIYILKLRIGNSIISRKLMVL